MKPLNEMTETMTTGEAMRIMEAGIKHMMSDLERVYSPGLRELARVSHIVELTNLVPTSGFNRQECELALVLAKNWVGSYQELEVAVKKLCECTETSSVHGDNRTTIDDREN